MELLLFILLSIGIIAIPGPNVLIIISTSVSQGRTRGLQTVAGTSVAMAIQLIVAALGTTYFISAITKGFIWLKWAGAAYLIYIGLKHLIIAFRKSQPSSIISAIGSFQRGFWVSLTNPKTILFFSAFLPQFADPTMAYLPQIALLSFLFLLLAGFLDSTYALLSSKLSGLIHANSWAKYQNGLNGIIYCGAGSLLLSAKSA